MSIGYSEDLLYTCITLYGLPRRQEERQPALLLRRRERPRGRSSTYRPPSLSRHRREGGCAGQRPYRSRPDFRRFPRFRTAGALWLAARQTGVFAVLESLWPAPRSGPSPAHYLLLAAIHRICQPGPKTAVSEWYRSTILEPAWDFRRSAFRSQDFWDAFEHILPEHLDPLSATGDPLDQAQLRMLGLWKEKQMVSRRLLSYDTTNFYTYIASKQHSQ